MSNAGPGDPEKPAPPRTSRARGSPSTRSASVGARFSSGRAAGSYAPVSAGADPVASGWLLDFAETTLRAAAAAAPIAFRLVDAAARRLALARVTAREAAVCSAKRFETRRRAATRPCPRKNPESRARSCSEVDRIGAFEARSCSDVGPIGAFEARSCPGLDRIGAFEARSCSDVGPIGAWRHVAASVAIRGHVLGHSTCARLVHRGGEPPLRESCLMRTPQMRRSTPRSVSRATEPHPPPSHSTSPTTRPGTRSRCARLRAAESSGAGRCRR